MKSLRKNKPAFNEQLILYASPCLIFTTLCGLYYYLHIID